MFSLAGWATRRAMSQVRSRVMEGSTTDRRSAVEQQADLEAGVPGGVVPPDAGNQPPTKAVEGSATWSLIDRLGLAFCWFLGLLFCAIAAAIVIYLLIQGITYLKLSQLTTPAAAGFTEGETGGFSDAFIGTMILGVMGISMALPIGVAIAVWLVEYGKPKALARVTELTIEAIAGIPSIVLALFGTVIFTSTALGFLSRSNEGVVFGRSFFAASSMLALEALPLIVASTREGLNAIPRHVREASYGVGKTKAATTRRILLPTAVRRSPPAGCSGSAGSSATPRSSSCCSARPRTSPRSKARPSRSTTCAAPAPR